MLESASALDRAWAFFVRQQQGFAGKAGTIGDWGRAMRSKGGLAEQVSRWRGRLGALRRFHERLSVAQIDNRCALEVIASWDSPDTVFYLDPPYVLEARVGSGDYRVEADDDHHRRLVAALLEIEGAAVLSGYETPLYAPLSAAGWDKTSFKIDCSSAGRVRGSSIRGGKAPMRTEVVWRNPQALQMLDAGPLFGFKEASEDD